MPGWNPLASRGPDPERGAGTAQVLGVVAVVLMLLIALAGLSAAQRARTQAQSAADLAALAAATALQLGYEPCAVAAEATAQTRVELSQCWREGAGVVQVETARKATGLPGRLNAQARAKARAGPAPGSKMADLPGAGA